MKTKFQIDLIEPGSSNFNLIIQDTTGTESIVNIAGYSNNNSFTEGDIMKYIFVVKNLWTGKEEKFVFSNSDNVNPPITHIPFGENVDLFPDDCKLMGFEDGEYSITAYVISNIDFEGDFYEGTEVVNNFSSAESFGEYFDAMYLNEEVYDVDSSVEDTVSLNSKVKVTTGTHEFTGALKTEIRFLLDYTLKERLMEAISSIAQNDCPDKLDISEISEANLYLWASREYNKKGDVKTAKEYYDLAKGLISKFNC